MIKNVVFDLGRVIYKFQPKEDLVNLGYNESQVNELMTCIFDSPLWLDMDRGLYTLPTFIEKVCADFPQHAKDIRRILDANWADRVETIMPPSLEFYYDVKNRGYKTYVLSNWSADGFDYIRSRDSFLFDKMDGIVVSGYENMVKPEPEIYQLLFSRYNLVPSESLFLDDNPDNIVAAKALGMHGIVFTNLDDCKRQFEALTANSPC